MKRIWILFILHASIVLAFPQSKDTSFVASSTPGTTTTEEKSKDTEKPDVPKKELRITEMHVFSNVSNRFATTTITSKVKNFGKEAREATFSVVLPDSAYITGFIMEIDGKNYTAYIKKKEEAKQEYDQAVASGIGAAHVAVSARDSNRFTVSVNVEPASKANFYLTYEELLKRKQNYELKINIHPKEPVPNLNVEVFINETSPLKFVRTPAIRSGNEIKKYEGDLDPRSVITNIDAHTARVTFSPDLKRQGELAKILGTKEEEGLSGQFVVEYDVERDSSGGEVLVKDGYFVHFFAPQDLTPLPKQVVFVLDTSGSMYGRRIEQLKTAMHNILKQLNQDKDLFNIVEFNSDVNVWDVNEHNRSVRFPKRAEGGWFYNYKEEPVEGFEFPEAFPVNPTTLKNANEVIDKLSADGGTNIFDALRVAIRLVNIQEKRNSKDNKIQPLIIFLTDGEPTVGVTQTSEITDRITKLNTEIPIFSLSFGDGADRNFLQKISLKNSGFSRHIYEAADAALQLQDFYTQISSPLLSNVQFKYTELAKEVTKSKFPNYFNGGEIIICGTIDGDFGKPKVHAWGIRGPIDFEPKIHTEVGGLERHWAYLTVQQLLEEEKESDKKNPENEKKALELALKYSFVTPLTSLVVVKPNTTDSKPVDVVAADKAGRERGRAHFLTPRKGVQQSFSRTKQFKIVPRARYGPQGFGVSGGYAPLSASFAGLPGLPGPPAYSGNVQFALAAAPPSFPAGGLAGGSYNYNRIPARPMASFDTESALDFDAPPVPARPLTTTYRPTTVLYTTTSTTVNPILDKLLTALSWLYNIYSPGEDSITLPQGTFKLGAVIPPVLNATLQTCQNAPNSTSGHCQLLQNCEKVYSLLTTVDIYKQHFCDIQGYAGVCCPV